MTNFLNYLNLIGAVLLMEFPNVRSHISNETLDRFQAWKDANVAKISTGDTIMCEGETGKDYPAIEFAEVGWTPETEIQIIVNEIKRLNI